MEIFGMIASFVFIGLVVFNGYYRKYGVGIKILINLIFGPFLFISIGLYLFEKNLIISLFFVWLGGVMSGFAIIMIFLGFSISSLFKGRR